MRDASPSSIPVGRAALFLDLDGSIVAIADTPSAVTASVPCRIVLRRALEQLRGRLAILSGRTIAAVDEVLSGMVKCVAGVHGLQRRTPLGVLEQEAPHGGIAEAEEVLARLSHVRPGLVVERKGSSVALHYRQAPAAEEAVIDAVQRLASVTGLEMQLGKAVAELRTPGPDKGTAMGRFMQEEPFAGMRPIFVGDDLTDEPGFAAARALGGMSVLVGERSGSAADGRLATPAAVLAWIMSSLDRGCFELPHAAPTAPDRSATAS